MTTQRQAKFTPEEEATLSGMALRLQGMIDSGQRPWRRGWVDTLHRNGHSGHKYAESLQLLLTLLGFSSPNWFTGEILHRYDATPKPGATPALVWGVFRTGGKATGSALHESGSGLAMTRKFIVYNRDDLDGTLPVVRRVRSPERTSDSDFDQEYLNAWLRRINVTIGDGGNRAYFSHAEPDKVFMPARTSFRSDAAYWRTVVHEVMHWTGAHSRLGRPRDASDERRAVEEVIAEFGACQLCARFRIPEAVDDREDHQAYLAGWASALPERPHVMLEVCHEVQRAIRFLEKAAAPRSISAQYLASVLF